MDERKAKRFSVLALLIIVGVVIGVLSIGPKLPIAKQLTGQISDSVGDTVDTAQDSINNVLGETTPGFYSVTKFLDGDTIAVNMDGQSETIRLIGVDTPETHDPRKAVQCFGQEAATFTKQLIGSEAVRLEADPTNNNRDKYGRLLRYVYLPDGRLVNAEIIKQGYGFAYVLYPFEKMSEFTSYQQNAHIANLGLWSRCVVNQTGNKNETNNL